MLGQERFLFPPKNTHKHCQKSANQPFEPEPSTADVSISTVSSMRQHFHIWGWVCPFRSVPLMAMLVLDLEAGIAQGRGVQHVFKPPRDACASDT